MTSGADTQLLARLQDVEARVRLAVDHRRGDDPSPDDPFRGLYVNDETVERLLDGPARPLAFGPVLPLVEDPGPLMTLARHAGLTTFDLQLLVIALLPDLDSRFEKLYGYLNDDVTRRRASIGLALELAGATPTSAAARRALSLSGPLVDLGLVLVEDPDRPYLARTLRVPDRVVSHLLGDTAPDPSVQHLLLDVEGYPCPLAERLGRAVRAGADVVHIREREVGTGAATAVAALESSGRSALVVDLTLATRGPEPDDAVLRCAREALIRGAGLVAGPVEALAEGHLESIQRLSSWPCPVVFVGNATWDPLWSTTPPLAVEAPILGARERITLLHAHLERAGADVDPDSLGAHLSLGPAQVQRAVRAAQTASLLGAGRITSAELRSGIRAQNAAGLERLARRIEPEVSWEDLVLAPAVRRSLQELTARARHRDQVLVDWRMRRGGGRGRGVSALFAGDSGTGKTMSAEVIAADLGLDLYTVNLATVVDKYVGETEKNLERIFSEAGGVNAVLFFDEADAIFGKRSEVRDAHDRYANIESAYLLQRLETFDGLAVLATNLRANIDEAFTRRLDAIVDFPAPTPDLREALWRQCLGPPLPLASDVDVAFCAESFELAGGNIRSAATTAAYLAAEAREPVTMAHVIAAVAQEYRKLGRLVLEKEFGRFLEQLIG
ncbi:MAG: AAA family ATPase [Nocardioides sp.]